ncbi:hypothetical protein Plhal304r1_c088g0170571 [Plasmopara halstedii]
MDSPMTFIKLCFSSGTNCMCFGDFAVLHFLTHIVLKILSQENRIVCRRY